MRPEYREECEVLLRRHSTARPEARESMNAARNFAEQSAYDADGEINGMETPLMEVKSTI